MKSLKLALLTPKWSPTTNMPITAIFTSPLLPLKMAKTICKSGYDGEHQLDPTWNRQLKKKRQGVNTSDSPNHPAKCRRRFGEDDLGTNHIFRGEISLQTTNEPQQDIPGLNRRIWNISTQITENPELYKTHQEEPENYNQPKIVPPHPGILKEHCPT